MADNHDGRGSNPLFRQIVSDEINSFSFWFLRKTLKRELFWKETDNSFV